MTEQQQWQAPEGLLPGPSGSFDVLGAIVAAMSAIGPVEKASTNTHERFAYRSADDVISAVQPALVEAGIVLVPEILSMEPTTLVSQRSEVRATEVRMRYRFFAASDASSVSVEVIVHAVGATAFAIGAAYSYALKYALSQLFAIPFADQRMDPEAGDGAGGQSETRVSAGPPPADSGSWWQRIGWDSEQAHADARAALVASLKALPPEQLASAKQALAEIPATHDSHVSMFAMDEADPTRGRLAPIIGRQALAEAHGRVAAIVGVQDEDLPRRLNADDDGSEPTPEETRRELQRIYLELEPSDADALQAHLVDYGLWPIDQIPDDRAEEAADAALQILFEGDERDDE